MPKPCPACGGSRYVFAPHPPESIWQIGWTPCPVCKKEGTLEPESVATDFPDVLPASQAATSEGAGLCVSGEIRSAS